MSDRYITVCFKVKDADSAKCFWNSHAAGVNMNGCSIVSISEGDIAEFQSRVIDALYEKSDENKEIIDAMGDEFYAPIVDNLREEKV